MQLNKILSKIEEKYYRNRINYFKTIYVNLRSLPFKDALKFPIYIYGKCSVISLSGRIYFTEEISKGMVKIGLSDPIRSLKSYSVINNNGSLKFGNNIVLRRGIKLTCASGAVVSFDSYSYIGDNVTIISNKRISLGRGVRVGNDSTFIDNDFHYLLNVPKRTIKNNIGRIEIGKFNWIGGNVTVKKGTITPDFTVVAGPYSMLSKDYSNILEPYSVIAGSPAKLITTGFLRISNSESEYMLVQFFKNNPEYFKINSDIDINEFCLPI